MDNLSFLIFFIYAMVILIILVYISPVFSAVVMILVPVASIYLLPDPAVQFLSLNQFTFMGVPIYNIHILLLIWSALIGIVVYSELLSWYLLMDVSPDASPQPDRLGAATDALISSTEPPKSAKNKIEDFLLRLGKIMSGGK